ncbi:hypothetical protein D9757_011011 [Collybiopsis confluens]|uniref:Cytochrome P450 n=1 Tax=Collybiopsis confluens TaxID=2823264 RepID=A0A8H5GD79_9AGAR|nr:hypothetical protein D9757_011011 [Collybiopsis confluens]
MHCILPSHAAAFGRRISWKDEEVPPGHDMSFKDAIHEVSAGAIIKVLVPKWAMGLTAYTRRKHMLEMIALRRNAEKKEEKSDLFTNLLDASADDPTFTVRDLTGNIFMFLVAGHETTGHTLCFTLALLALYPDQQEILYQHIKSIIPDGRLPGYEEMSQFTQSMAVFYETLRMFPSVNVVPKHSAEDTSLTLDNAAGEKYILPIPQGTHLAISIVGMHYNPRYWKDPEEFRPARFLDPDWPRDAFLPFSGGLIPPPPPPPPPPPSPHHFVINRFAEIEAVATLTMLVSKYKIEVKEEPQFANETFEQRKARVLASKPGLTMTPIRAPLVFKRR